MSPARILPLILCAAALAMAPQAWADEPISTASDSGSTGAPGAAPAPKPLDAPRMGMADDDIVGIGPCGAVRRASDDGPADTRPHGAVEIGIGTRGYRHAAGVVCKPIGPNSAVTVAVDYTEWNGARHRHFGEGHEPFTAQSLEGETITPGPH